MTVEQIGEKYRCNIFGKEVEVIKVGGGTLVCIGQNMELVDTGEYEQISRNLPDSGGDYR